MTSHKPMYMRRALIALVVAFVVLLAVAAIPFIRPISFRNGGGIMAFSLP